MSDAHFELDPRMASARWQLAVLLTAVSVLMFANSAWATLVKYSPISTMAKRADRVVMGRVLKVEAVRKGKTIVTRTTIAVQQSLKFAGGTKTVVVESLGGEVGNYGVHVEGTAKFAIGEDVLVFLRQHATQTHFRLISMSLGKFSLAKVGQEIVAKRNLRGLSVMRISGKSPASAVFPKVAIHLDDLLYEIDRSR